MRRRGLGCLVVVVVAACTDEGPVGGPGAFDAVLVSPNGAGGAALIELSGEGLGDALGLGDTEVFRSDGSGPSRFVLVNQAGGDLAFRIEVADTTRPPSAVIEQVAGPDDELRADVSAYRLELLR